MLQVGYTDHSKEPLQTQNEEERTNAISNLVKLSGSKKRIRHDRRLAPFEVSVYAVMLLFLLIALPISIICRLLLRDSGHLRITPTLFSTVVNYSLHPPLSGSENQILPGTLFALVLWSVPLSSAFILKGWWLDGLQSFYAMRQPWVELWRSAPAHLSLNLDYTTGPVLLKSIRNRHWVVFLFSIVSLVSLTVPLLLAGVFHLKWIRHSMDPVSISRYSSWNDNGLIESDVLEVEKAIPKSMRGMADPSNLPLWVYGSYALLPTDVVLAQDRIESTGFWQMSVEARRAELECKEVQIQARSREVTTIGTKRMFLVEPFTLLAANDSHHDQTLPSPCTLTTQEDKISETGEAMDAVCGRWQLVHTDTGPPRWLIVLTYGPAKRTSVGLLFLREPSSIAVSCYPQVYRSNGTISIISPRTLFINESLVHSYENVTEERLNDTSALKFSSMLNTSNAQPSSSSGTIMMESPEINTSHFTGDLLSFMLYRYHLLQMKTPFQTEILKASISKVFSLIFPNFVDGSSVLNDNVRSETVITPIRWSQSIFVRPWALYSLVGVTSFITLVASIFGVPMQRYMFPVDVNTFEGALYLLYPSNIPKLLERIPRLEKLSLNEFHARTQAFKMRYKLGTLPGGGECRFLVDSEERFETWEDLGAVEDPRRDHSNPIEIRSASRVSRGDFENLIRSTFARCRRSRRRDRQGEEEPLRENVSRSPSPLQRVQYTDEPSDDAT